MEPLPAFGGLLERLVSKDLSDEEGFRLDQPSLRPHRARVQGPVVGLRWLE